MNIGVHLKYLLFLSGFKETWIFWTDFSENARISLLIEIRPVGAVLLPVNRRKDEEAWRN
jgi:hypothetical protein